MNDYLELLQPLLASFSLTTNFGGVIESIFGSQSPEEIELLHREWSASTWILPAVEVVSGEALNGAVGGYATETGKIYLSSDLLALGDSGLLTKILLEEYGHAIDARLNGGRDSAGDEGELFAAMVSGLPLDSGELERIKTELDQSLLTLETGEVVAIEMATLVKEDIRARSSGSNPSNLTNVNGTLYFRAYTDANGEELWKSDGTAAGTVLVKDIRAGSNSSSASYLTNVNGTLYFRANDGTNGEELWKSDGTAAGTVLVKDIRVGNNGSGILDLTDINGTLYFRATTDGNGNELWKSDGTAAGTVLVKDINARSSSSNPSNLTNVNGTLSFTANDGTNGGELWKSDGTATGTVLVKDIRARSSGSNPSNLTNVNGTLYFRANDGTNGEELWKSDGTAAGTVLVKDINQQVTATSYVDSTVGEITTFNNPTGSLTINGGAGANIFNLNSISSGFAGDLSTNSSGYTNGDMVNLNADPHSNDFTIDLVQTINVATASSDSVRVIGQGSTSGTGSGNNGILLEAGNSKISSVDGAINLTDTSASSLNIGLRLIGGGGIQSTGNATINFTGTGGFGYDYNAGIDLNGANLI